MQHSSNVKDFVHGTRQNRMKLGRQQMVEFKKSFKLYGHISSKVLTKVGINFIHFAWMGKLNFKKKKNCFSLPKGKSKYWLEPG
jgi:hypothetical protein